MQIIYVVPKPNMEQTIKRMLNAIGCNLEVKTVYYEDKTEQYYGNIFLFHGYVDVPVIKNIAIKNKEKKGININIVLNESNDRDFAEINIKAKMNEKLNEMLEKIIKENQKEITFEEEALEGFQKIAMRSGKTIAIFSSKGGVGKTGCSQTIGEGSKYFLSEGMKGIVVDLNLEEGSFSKIFTALPSQYKLEDFLKGFRNEIEEEKNGRIVLKHDYNQKEAIKKLRPLLRRIIVEKPTFEANKTIKFPFDVMFSPSENKSEYAKTIYNRAKIYLPLLIETLKEDYDLIVFDCHNSTMDFNGELFKLVDHIGLVLNTDRRTIEQNREFVQDFLRTETLKQKIIAIYNEYDEADVPGTDEAVLSQISTLAKGSKELEKFIDEKTIYFPKITRFRKITNNRDALFNAEKKYLSEEEWSKYLVNLEKFFKLILPNKIEKIAESKNSVYKKTFSEKMFSIFFGDKND